MDPGQKTHRTPLGLWAGSNLPTPDAFPAIPLRRISTRQAHLPLNNVGQRG